MKNINFVKMWYHVYYLTSDEFRADGLLNKTSKPVLRTIDEICDGIQSHEDNGQFHTTL